MNRIAPFNLTEAASEAFRYEARSFIDRFVSPIVDKIEDEQNISDAIIQQFAKFGLLGAHIPHKYDGRGLNSAFLGILHEELGKSHASVENMITVIGMASAAIMRGSPQMKETWLPKIARGEIIPAFALTEPQGGSDIQSINSCYHAENDHYIISGQKKWITLGSRADIFIIFAQHEGKGSAFLVPKNTQGLHILPITGMLGFRGNMLAEISLNQCRISKDFLIGKEGAGIDLVGSLALSEGRYATAWGALGLAQASYEKAANYISNRKQSGRLLKDLDIIKQMIAQMITSISAARQLCEHAAILREQGDHRAIQAAIIAKYFASKSAAHVTEKSIQLLGAYGCHREAHVERYFRDSKIYQLIEGASEVLEIQIADMCLNDTGTS